MRIAVLGGNGDMGSSLVPYLLEQGNEVISVDRVLPAVQYPVDGPRARYYVANVVNFGEVIAAVDGCDAIVLLAAYRSPMNHPAPVVYSENTTISYNVLYAAATLGIKRVCMASSINAIGGVYSRQPTYDYFPLDEMHPNYSEDPYSLSKWILEEQGSSFARRHEDMSIASMRFHWLVDTRERAQLYTRGFLEGAMRHLWAYTLLEEASRAIYLTLTADYKGHEVFYIVAPRTAVEDKSLELARRFYPETEIRGDLSGNASFFNCGKAERILGWRHED